MKVCRKKRCVHKAVKRWPREITCIEKVTTRGKLLLATVSISQSMSLWVAPSCHVSPSHLQYAMSLLCQLSHCPYLMSNSCLYMPMSHSSLALSISHVYTISHVTFTVSCQVFIACISWGLPCDKVFSFHQSHLIFKRSHLQNVSFHEQDFGCCFT